MPESHLRTEMQTNMRRLTFLVLLLSLIAGIAVTSTGCGVAADTKLQMEIKDALAADRNVNSDNLTVNVKDGVVTISGELGTREEIDRVVEIASAIEGVIEVKNQMNLPDTFGSTNPTMLYY